MASMLAALAPGRISWLTFPPDSVKLNFTTLGKPA